MRYVYLMSAVLAGTALAGTVAAQDMGAGAGAAATASGGVMMEDTNLRASATVPMDTHQHADEADTPSATTPVTSEPMADRKPAAKAKSASNMSARSKEWRPVPTGTDAGKSAAEVQASLNSYLDSSYAAKTDKGLGESRQNALMTVVQDSAGAIPVIVRPASDLSSMGEAGVGATIRAEAAAKAAGQANEATPAAGHDGMMMPQY